MRDGHARGGAGLDIYLTNVLSIGGLLTGEVMVLTRPGVSPREKGDSIVLKSRHAERYCDVGPGSGGIAAASDGVSRERSQYPRWLRHAL